jgi:hypothetical protein
MRLLTCFHELQIKKGGFPFPRMNSVVTFTKKKPEEDATPQKIMIFSPQW